MVETTIIQQFFFKLTWYSKDIAEKIIYFLKNWSELNSYFKKKYGYLYYYARANKDNSFYKYQVQLKKYSNKMFSLHTLNKDTMVFFGNDQCHNISSYKMPYHKKKTPQKIINKSKYSNVVQKYWQIAIKDNWNHVIEARRDRVFDLLLHGWSQLDLSRRSFKL